MALRGPVLWLACAVGCAPLPASPAGLPGSGGGALGAPLADTAAPVWSWQGYDAAVIRLAGEVVCDRVWDTVGAGSELDCPDCAFAISVTATLREDVGAGTDCPQGAYEVAYAWRPASDDPDLPLGLLAHQPAGWVWIGDGAWQGERFVGQGVFVDGERETAFTVAGLLRAP